MLASLLLLLLLKNDFLFEIAYSNDVFELLFILSKNQAINTTLKSQ